MRMHAILDAGVDPNQLMVTSGGWIVDEAGRLVSSETEDSPLVAALRNTNFDAMKALLERGADANLTPEGAEPPLVMAASSGRPAFVQVLLEYGAELERTGASGRTALLWAVRMNRVACAVYLYKAGAEQGALAIEWANALGFEKLSAALAVLAPHRRFATDTSTEVSSGAESRVSHAPGPCRKI